MFDFLFGCVTIKTEGIGIDKWLNSARNEGILLRDIRRDQYTRLTARAALRHLSRLFALCPETLEITVLSSSGLVPYLRGMAREWARIAAYAAAFVFVCFSLSRLWQVDVVCTDSVLAGRVESSLYAMGITAGCPVWQIDLREVESRLLSAYPEFKFVQADRVGTVLTVTPVPLEDTPGIPDPPENACVVSACEGVVEKITVFSGTAAVSVGDQVSPGQVLVEALTSPTPELAQPRPVTAHAQILARVWYSACAGREDLERAGRLVRTKTYYRLRIGSWIVPLYREDTGELLPAGETDCPGPWERCPVALEKYISPEYESIQLQTDAALTLLGTASARKAMEQIPADARILNMTQITGRDKAGYPTVQTLMEVCMDIARYGGPDYKGGYDTEYEP